VCPARTGRAGERCLGYVDIEARVPGCEKIVVSPDLIDLDHAEGVVPAGCRNVSISLRRTEDGFEASIRGGDEAVELPAAPGLKLVKADRSGDLISALFQQADAPNDG
jgi:hypothetical protein